MSGSKRLVGTVGFVLCSALVGTLTGRTTYAEVSVDVSVVAIHTDSDFYQPLSSYGQWQVVGSYGSCWIPGGVAAGWCPYSSGYWQQTDAGWYWASSEPWAWATYHYGGWDFSPQFGWYWVPQTQWAPAWVSWREGGGCVGWAPLGPSGRVIVDVGGGVPRGYVFVQERQFLDPVSSKTIIVNNITISKTVINKQGPGTATIEKATGRKVQAVPVRELRNKDEAKVLAKRATPTPTTAKAVETSVRSQVEKPAVKAAEPQPSAAKSEAQQSEQNRIAKLDEDKRAQQEKAQATDSEKVRPVPAAVQAKPEAKPETKVESKPAAERPAPTREPTEQKPQRDDEKKD
jgi:hypothetical protein